MKQLPIFTRKAALKTLTHRIYENSAEAAKTSHDQALQLKRESISLQNQLSSAFKLNV